MKHCNSVELDQMFRMSSPLHKRKDPPQLKTFWRRFCARQWASKRTRVNSLTCRFACAVMLHSGPSAPRWKDGSALYPTLPSPHLTRACDAFSCRKIQRRTQQPSVDGARGASLGVARRNFYFPSRA